MRSSSERSRLAAFGAARAILRRRAPRGSTLVGSAHGAESLARSDSGRGKLCAFLPFSRATGFATLRRPQDPWKDRQDEDEMRKRVLVGAFVAALSLAVPAAATAATESLVTNGSPTTPFPRNKQNEPAVAVDPLDPSVVVAGANAEI